MHEIDVLWVPAQRSPASRHSTDPDRRRGAQPKREMKNVRMSQPKSTQYQFVSLAVVQKVIWCVEI